MRTLSVGFYLCFWVTLAWTDVSPVFLTHYLNSNNTSEGRNLSSVDPKQFLNVTSFSGYITVDEEKGSNLFFWYFPVADANVSTTPLIIWLQGGPGGTSLVGTFLEIGPFEIRSDGSGLQSRASSWAQEHSLLFIDNPVGTGLSFTKQEGYVKKIDDLAEHLYSFLQQFLTVFPELRSAPLFIAGESYAGRYVPAFARKVYEVRESHDGERKINLQGLIMGNPLFNYGAAANFSQIFYQWGLVDQQGVLAAKEIQDAYIAAIKNNAVDDARQLRGDLLDRLQDLSAQPQLYNVLQYSGLDTDTFSNYINTMSFKRAVHGIDKPIDVVNRVVQNEMLTDYLLNMDSTMDLLLEHYRILIYCGQLDLTEPCVPNAEARRRNWRWSGRDNFLKAHRKSLQTDPEIVAGYFKSGGSLTEVLVNGAGHLVPIDKPEVAKLIISHFVKGVELPTRSPALNFNDVPDLDSGARTTDSTSSPLPNTWNTVSWVLNGVLIVFIVVCGIMYMRHKIQYRDYLFNDDDSLNNAVLTMS